MFSLDRWLEVFDTIRRNKLRTALTAISVAWGIFVLVFLLGLGRGLDNGLRRTFARDATNGIWLRANKTSVAHEGYDVGRRITFDNRDFDSAKATAGIEQISGRFYMGGFEWGSMLTKRGAKANSFQINAVHPGAFYLQGHSISQGRFLDEGDLRDRRKSAVIGRPVASFLFEPTENPIGDWIVVAGVPFQVVGVFTDPGGAEQERQLYIPVSTAQLAFNGNDRLNALEFTVGDATASEAKAISKKIVAQLAERHQFDPTDVQAVRVQDNVEQFERFSKLFWMISTFVIVIGLGTLAAGVVGVSNIMMIAVKERTKEIGIRKALGATPWSIIFMIIQESVFLTGIAGLSGLSAGVGLLGLLADGGGMGVTTLLLAGSMLLGGFGLVVTSVVRLIKNRPAAWRAIGGLLAMIVGGMLFGVAAMAKPLDTEFIHNPSIDIRIGIAAAIFLMIAGALAGFIPARAAAKVNPIETLREG